MLKKTSLKFEWPKLSLKKFTLMEKALSQDISSFEYRIKRKELITSYDIVKATLRLIERSIRDLHDKKSILHALNFILNDLVLRFPNDYLIQNICVRVRKHLELESIKLQTGKAPPEPENSSNFNIRRSNSNFQMTSYKSIMDLFFLGGTSDSSEEEEEEEEKMENPDKIDYKVYISEIVAGFTTTLEKSYSSISQQAKDFICEGDVILTLGYSQAVLNFLTANNFKSIVLLPERAPDYDGYKMAQILKERTVKAIVLPDSAIFAILPKVQKIIVPARFVLANGGIISYSLAAPLALAAKHHSTPFIALYWEMKLTRTMPSPNTSFALLASPTGLASRQPDLNSPVLLNPSCDYVPPELITLMVGPSGAHSPSDVFFLTQEDNDSD